MANLSMIAVLAGGMAQGTAARTTKAVPATRLGANPDAGPPNIQQFQTMPLTRVNPVLEQGRGRAPGQQWGHMPHSVILNFTSLANMNVHPDLVTRAQIDRRTPGTGTGQQVSGKRVGPVPQTLPAPRTVTYAVSGGEPL